MTQREPGLRRANWGVEWLLAEVAAVCHPCASCRPLHHAPMSIMPLSAHVSLALTDHSPLHSPFTPRLQHGAHALPGPVWRQAGAAAGEERHEGAAGGALVVKDISWVLLCSSSDWAGCRGRERIEGAAGGVTAAATCGLHEELHCWERRPVERDGSSAGDGQGSG